MKTVIIYFSFFLLIMTSCREPKDLVFRDFKNISLTDVNFSTAKLTMDLVYYNPNNFSLELNKTDLDIFVNNNFLGKSLQDIQVKIPKRQEFTVPLKVDVDMKNLLKNGLNTLFNKEVSIRFLGKVKVGKAGVMKNFNVDYTTLQEIPLFK